MNNFNDKVNFIWSIAELLRGPYKPNQYKDVMLPLVVLRCLDCVLEPTGISTSMCRRDRWRRLRRICERLRMKSLNCSMG